MSNFQQFSLEQSHSILFGSGFGFTLLCSQSHWYRFSWGHFHPGPEPKQSRNWTKVWNCWMCRCYRVRWLQWGSKCRNHRIWPDYRCQQCHWWLQHLGKCSPDMKSLMVARRKWRPINICHSSQYSGNPSNCRCTSMDPLSNWSCSSMKPCWWQCSKPRSHSCCCGCRSSKVLVRTLLRKGFGIVTPSPGRQRCWNFSPI